MYPRTIDNGHGERMTFLGVDGDRLLHLLARRPGRRPADARPPPPDRDDPRRSGRIGVEIAGRARRASPAPARRSPSTPASRTASGTPATTTLVLAGEVFPPDNLEYFLTQVYASTAAHGGRPGALDGAFLLTRYRSEFAMTAIPAPGPPLRLPDPGLPRPRLRPLRPLLRRPGPGPPPHERYTPRPHDQRP